MKTKVYQFTIPTDVFDLLEQMGLSAQLPILVFLYPASDPDSG